MRASLESGQDLAPEVHGLVQLRHCSADTTCIEGILIILGVVIGAAAGRWWAVGFAVPIGLWFALEFHGLENSSPPYWGLGAAVALIAAVAIAGGILLRRLPNRRRVP
jgi:hypothetical protein